MLKYEKKNYFDFFFERAKTKTSRCKIYLFLIFEVPGHVKINFIV